jgi:hypothetical protein
MSPKNRDSAAGCVALLIIVGAIVLFNYSSTFFFGFLAPIVAFILFWVVKFLAPKIANRGVAFFVLAVAIGCSIALTLGYRQIGFCFVTALVWLAGLAMFRRHGLKKSEGAIASMVKNSIDLAVILCIVTGLLAALSLVLSHFPPDRIFQWSEGFNQAKKKLEAINKIMKPAMLALAAIYFLTLWSESTRGRYSKLWKTASVTGKWLKRAALAAMVVASFSFTASRAHSPGKSDGPLDVLTKAKAEALSAYSDLAWKIEARMGAELRMQVVAAALAGMPPNVAPAANQEAGAVRKADKIPAAYFQGPNNHQSIRQLTSFDPTYPRKARRRDLMAKLPPSTDDLKAPLIDDLPVTSSEGFKRSEIDAGIEEVNQVAEKAQNQAPQWMSGVGEEVLKKFFSAGASPSRVEFIKQFSKDYPLMGAVLDVAVDAAKDSLFRIVHERAGKLAASVAKGEKGDLLTRIRSAVADLIPKITISPDLKLDAEVHEVEVREADAKEARKRMDADIEQSMKTIEGWIAEVKTQMNDLGLKIPEYRRSAIEGQLDSPSSLELEPLQKSLDHFRFYRRTIATAMAHSPQDPKWRGVLGADYDTFNTAAQRIREQEAIANRNAEAARAERQKLEKLLEERRVTEREIRVP